MWFDMAKIHNNLFLYIFCFTVGAILCDDCHPCRCEFYYFNARITCSDDTVEFFNPLRTIPKINYSQTVEWNTIEIFNQPLKKLDANAFSDVGLFYLELITLNYCEISRINENTFENVTSLYDLDLSFNSLSELDDNLFKHTKYMKYIKLNGNKIQFINDKLFIDLPELETLELNENNLIYFHEYALIGNKKLKQLQLRNNNLTTLNINIIKTIKSLSIMKIAGNPFICDCLIEDLHSFMVEKFKMDRSNYEKEITGTACAAPKVLKGVSWRKLTEENFNCWLTTKSFKKKVKSIIDESVQLSCIVNSNSPPIVKWALEDKFIDITSKKYNVNITRIDYTEFKYSLEIRNLERIDEGVYRCIFEDNSTTPTSDKIKLVLEKRPYSVLTITIIIGCILFAFCVIALIIKCVIKFSIATSTRQDQPNFEDFKYDDQSNWPSKQQHYRGFINTHKL